MRAERLVAAAASRSVMRCAGACRCRRLLSTGVLAAIVAMGLSTTRTSGQGPATAVGERSKPPKDTWTALRTPWGDVDIQGIWSAGYILTPLERPAAHADKEFLSDDEVAALEAQAAGTFGIGSGAIPMPRGARGTEADVSGAYNDVFAGRGRHVVRTKRTSLIIDPRDGRIPPRTPAGLQRDAQRPVSGLRGVPADNPEDRPPDDRCFGTGLPVAFGHPATAGAHSRIVQAPGVLSIYYEQNRGGTYRTIAVARRPRPPAHVRQWLGIAHGRWEGDTIVVETMHFSDKTNYYGSRETLHLVERFTRAAADLLMYRVTIDDPSTFTRPWTIEVPLTKLEDARNQIFENACHEGNYALTNILAGARSLASERWTATSGGSARASGTPVNRR